jgi:hypothetical protein
MLMPMRFLIAIPIALFLCRVVAGAEPPKAFRLEDLTISMSEQPRWPVGYSLSVVIHRGKVTIRRTVLPCDPCRESEEQLPISDAEVLRLLNLYRASGFFDAASEYSSTLGYFRGSDGVVREGETVTTDEDRITLALQIGTEWRKEVLDDGEAPDGLRDLQDAIFSVARLRRQAQASN